MSDFEKLGLFYLGREYDLGAGQRKPGLVLYDSKHLVTHAVVVGMTGSGKTGLCIDLLEEAAIDGVPVIAIDPKGDIANLLLAFPGLSPAEFAPWIDPAEAQRKGLPPEAYAAEVAKRWQDGLAEWGQDAARVRRFRDSADVAVYTPGSNAGILLSILKSLAAPKADVLEDGELLRERITTTVTGLLGLLGIEADPMQSREHILLSTLIERAWRAGEDLDLAALIPQLQSPPITKVGVLELESFFPSKDRFALVMAMNNLLASPGFSAWLEGEPLDVAAMLSTPEGKPRISIVSIAHLDDAQRMFFVTLLLNQILGWTRAQSGTSSLRAILYMDEIFGYFPPVANPPSKRPLLTLLKQSRAFGLGIVLATQNPVDLDYKGLSNTGTWFLGRLQTERDKQRVLEGLEGAAATAGSIFDRARMEQTLAGLGNRVFLMNDVHSDGPIVFESRWALSYLRGPVTRNEIKALMEAKKAVAPAASAAPPAEEEGPALDGEPTRPALPPEVPQFFLPVKRPVPQGRTLVYRPMVFGAAKVAYADSKTGVDVVESVTLLTPITDEAVPVHWDRAHAAQTTTSELVREPNDDALYLPLAAAAGNPKKYASWQKELVSHLFATRRLELLKSPSTKAVSRPDENERDFRLRLGQVAREARDAELEKLRTKYAPKVAKLDERVKRAEQGVNREIAQAEEQQISTAFNFGATILGALTGRKAVSQANVGRVARTARGARRVAKERSDVDAARQNLLDLREQRRLLEDQFRADVAALEARMGSQEVLEPLQIKPKKSAIEVQLVALAWAPYARDDGGVAMPLF